MIQRKAGDPESMVLKTMVQKKKWSLDELKAKCDSVNVTYRPGDENHVVRYIASSQVVDRESDVMVMAGGDFTLFKTNPVFIWAHDMYTKPLGMVINIEVSGDKLIADVLYNCITDESADLCEMALSGHIKAVSIGFRGKVGGVKFPNDAERQALGMRPGGLIFEQWELYELSQCTVGMNQEALQVRNLKKRTIALLKGFDPSTILEEDNSNEEIDMKPEEITKSINDAVTAAIPGIITAVTAAIKPTEVTLPADPIPPPVKPAEANKALAAFMAGNPSLFGAEEKTGLDALIERHTTVKETA